MPKPYRFQGMLFALLAACSRGGERLPPVGGDSSLAGVQPHGAHFSVVTHGSLQNLMDQGQTAPVIEISRIKADKSRVGLGLLSALRGEFIVIEGEAWVAYPNNDGTLRANELGTNDETAAFVVSAAVPSWQSLALPDDCVFGDLDAALEKLGENAGLNVDEPFPFLVEGALVNLAFSVVDGRAFASDTKFSREALMAASVKAKYASTRGTLVGFFAKGQHPEFLEPESSLHLHVVLPAEKQTGHVDHVDLPRGTSFRLPVPKR